MEGVLDAMAYAESLNIIHRDLKPDNIFLDLNENGSIKTVFVADWGEARTVSIYDKNPNMTLERGTDPYKAPEVSLEKGEGGKGDYSI